ncbi:uncharacterized protein CIMG_12664 [Coccidioides immitis RS]|uniref:Uncharacterized protein n=1 Tax=Coccidioides immitis (strain RS) TaxID=246410 RepID=A0A0D8JUN9_COCIM|nr:uncharacterized protein CIMG_12664 [Coccidioides immitis RS]KJF59993.1 hypothetical protein CIMG_12664 [Coccidioides immitis RS]
MLKETSSINDKSDALNGEVVKALQEISVILKEIQEIQETNFIAVSNIKNALNVFVQLLLLAQLCLKKDLLKLLAIINCFQNPDSDQESSIFSVFNQATKYDTKDTPVVKNPDANKKNAEKNDADNKNINKNDADKNANNKNANEKGAENENAKKADANVTFNVSSKDFQNWFFSQGDL